MCVGCLCLHNSRKKKKKKAPAGFEPTISPFQTEGLGSSLATAPQTHTHTACYVPFFFLRIHITQAICDDVL